MKSVSKNLVIFAGLLFILTICFRLFLSQTLQYKQFTSAWIIAALYGIIVFIIGWTFGKKEKMFLPLYDIGFRFHLVTYIICNLIAEAWYFFGFQSIYENVITVHLTVIFWGIVLIFHFVLFLITRKNAIKGIKKSNIFE